MAITTLKTAPFAAKMLTTTDSQNRITDNLTFTGNVTMSGNKTFSGTTTINGTTNFNNTADFNNTANFNSSVFLSSTTYYNGRDLGDQLGGGADMEASYSYIDSNSPDFAIFANEVDIITPVEDVGACEVGFERNGVAQGKCTRATLVLDLYDSLTAPTLVWPEGFYGAHRPETDAIMDPPAGILENLQARAGWLNVFQISEFAPEMFLVKRYLVAAPLAGGGSSSSSY